MGFEQYGTRSIVYHSAGLINFYVKFNPHCVQIFNQILEVGSKNDIHPTQQGTMARKKGAKTLSPETRKAIHDMTCIGVRNCDIAKYYKVHQSTISKIIRHQKLASTIVKKKMGRPRKLSERGMLVFKKYILSNCFESLYVIAARFNATSGLELSESTAKRYMKKLHLHSFAAIQKPFLSTKNISARITWAHTH